MNLKDDFKVADLSRQGFINGDISIVMSPRTVIMWAENARIFKDLGFAFRLTFLNKEVEETVDIRPAEELWIPSPTGKKIHTFIVKPHGFDPSKKYPLIVNVHGGPQMQWADAFRGDLHALEALRKRIADELRNEILVSARIELLEHGSLPRGEGKAVRVRDERHEERDVDDRRRVRNGGVVQLQRPPACRRGARGR